MTHRVVVLLLVLTGGVGCKVQSELSDMPSEAGSDERGEPIIDAYRSSEGFRATDETFLAKNSSFYFRVWDETFTRQLDALPTSGEVPADHVGHSGSYYPESEGGTDVVVSGSMSPLQKYDLAFNNGQSLAARWERSQHVGGPTWAGHCNGWAAAAQRHPKEAARPVVRGTVTFAPEDIKALLAETYMSADYEFLGGNRCAAGGEVTSPLGRPNPSIMGDCEDINPGTFHAALTNWVGRKGHMLLMDLNRDEQVWNHPIVSFQVLAKDNVSADEARRQVVGDNGGPYVFNPLAVRFVLARVRVNYLVPTKHETLNAQYLADPPLELTYVLEVDSNGDLVGGEWTAASRQRHPDFIWVALPPLDPNGTRYMGNPYIDKATVIKMWAESAGFDPEHPPTDIERPSGPEEWGHFPEFDAQIDGNDHGAVFAGGDAKLRLKRHEPLRGPGVVAEVELDGQPLGKVTAQGDEDLVISVPATFGLHRLEVVFKRGNVTLLEPQSLRFRTIR